MKIKFKSIRKPAKIDSIKNLEKECNIKLPIDYKSFMLKNNGGIFDTKFVYIIKKKKGNYGFIDVEELYNIKYIKSVLYEINNKDISISWEGKYCLRNSVIPIGRTSDFGNILLGIKNKKFGKIFCIDTFYEGHFEEISESFTDFINGFEILKSDML